MKTISCKHRAESLQNCIDHALEYFELDEEEYLECDMWEQRWPNAGCGFGGVSGQAITTALTVIIWVDSGVDIDRVCVFHNPSDPNMGIAYVVVSPTDLFWSDAQHRDLDGQAAYEQGSSGYDK